MYIIELLAQYGLSVAKTIFGLSRNPNFPWFS